MKLFRIFTSLLLLSLALPSFSQGASAGTTPTKQQLEQFKKLPKQQQEMIAEKYGFDLSLINNSQSSENKNGTKNLQSVFPREDTDEDDTQLSEEEKYKPEEDELKPYGYELFSGEPTTFEPSENALVPDSYIVGPGDTFTVNLYGKESSEEEVMVNREGRLVIANLSPINVAGMQYKDVVKLLKTKVEQEVIGTKAFVSMGQIRSIRIMVLGESYKPGAYTVPALASITHALFVSGGLTEIASLRNIQLKRAGKIVETLDLYDLLMKGDSTADVILKPGDVVFIPPVGKQVTVDGEVRRPAIYELKNNETAENLIDMAGGIKASANPHKTVIERYTNNSFKTVLQLDLVHNDQKLENGDKLTIPKSSKELSDAVTLLGAVNYPGSYSWSKGDKVSRLFNSPQSDLLPIADYDYGLIVRESNAKGDIEVHQFSPILAAQHDENNDLLLKPRDTIVIFSRYQEKSKEESALASMALTKEELRLKEKVKLWEDYEEKKFYEFIDSGNALDKELAKRLEEEEQKSASSINELLQGDQKELKDEDYAVFSREKLLRPIIAKLNQQATYKKHVKVFSVNGEVRFEGVYPLPINANVSKAVAAAGGLKESSYMEKAEITRYSSNSTKILEHVNFSLVDALAEPSKVAINSKDTVNIYPIPNWQTNLQIIIKGEVRFPGTYSISKGESLKSVLSRAGGFTEFAEPSSAIFTRESIRLKQQEQLNKLTEDLRRNIAAKSFTNSITDSSLTYEDMSNLISDLGKTKAVGRLVIDLPSVESGQMNLTLQNNDSLYVPAKSDSISVVGEVNFATSHIYTDNKTIDDYINNSGGLKARADKDRIYIIKASGLVTVPEENSWFAVSNVNEGLSPGDTIVVPLDTEHVDNLTLWSKATQIIYQMGVALAAISAL